MCDTLALSDRNPEAVAAINETLAHPSNAWLAGRVQPYLSDGLEAIPSHEMWDLVVANPPHFGSADWQGAEGVLENVLTGDRGWALHRAFYAGVRAHLRGNGRIIFQENGQTSEIASLYDMIRAGGLKLIAPTGWWRRRRAEHDVFGVGARRRDIRPAGHAFAATAPATPAVWACCASHKPARPRARRGAARTSSPWEMRRRPTFTTSAGPATPRRATRANNSWRRPSVARHVRIETPSWPPPSPSRAERAVDDDDARASDDRECRAASLTTHDHDYPADMPDGAGLARRRRAGRLVPRLRRRPWPTAAAPSRALPTASTGVHPAAVHHYA